MVMGYPVFINRMLTVETKNELLTAAALNGTLSVNRTLNQECLWY